MKIVLAPGWYYPESTGGTEAYVAALARRFRAAGHEVLVATPSTTITRERTGHYDGIAVYRYEIKLPASRAVRQGFLPAQGARRFHGWLARIRPDVVHLHSFVPGLGLWELEAARTTGARTIATVHQPSLGYLCQRGTMMFRGQRLCDGLARPAKCADCVLRGRGLPGLLARALAAMPAPLGRSAGRLPGKAGTALGMAEYVRRRINLQCELLRAVDRFVLLTRWALDTVAANGAPRDKLVLNRLGVEHNSPDGKASPDEAPTRAPVTVGYLGRFEALKGTEILARAFASLPASLALHLEFRGPLNGAADRATAERLAHILADDPRVTFAPPVPHDQVTEILTGYDVLCCPSVCVEGGPTVALEALDAGTPVLGTRIGGLAEILEKGGGFLVPPGDEKALAEALTRIVTDPEGTVDSWRRHLPPVRTMDEVATDYLALYAK